MSVFVCIFVSFDVSVPLDVLNVIDIPVDIEASDCFSVLVGIVDPVDVDFPVKTSFVDSLPVGFTVTIFVAFTVEDSFSVILIVPVCVSFDFVVSFPISVRDVPCIYAFLPMHVDSLFVYSHNVATLLVGLACIIFAIAVHAAKFC